MPNFSNSISLQSRRSRVAFGKAFVNGILALCVFAASAQAITIDDFDGDQNIAASPPAGNNSSGISVPTALGGARTVRVDASAGPSFLNLRAATFASLYAHSQDATVGGSSQIAWDGDSNTAINSQGLGGVNLTQDGATALRLKVLSFDFAGGKPMTITVTVYDSTDPTGNKFSSGSFVLTQLIVSPTNVDLPFVNLTTSGSAGPVDFKKVGAIKLFIDGSTPDVDLQLEWFGTNGKCSEIPVGSQMIIDECGVCSGDGSSCADCNGLPNGPNPKGGACSTGQSGLCQAGTWSNTCTCVSNSGLTTDSCGVCGGDGTSCNDCNGVKNGTSILDRCSVCGGDGKSCLGCVEREQSMTLAALDATAKRQEAVIKGILNELGRVDRKPTTKRWITSMLSKAHHLQIRNWVLSWTFPTRSQVCQNVEFCPRATLTPISAEYKTHAGELRRIAIDGIRRLVAVKRRSTGVEKRAGERNEALYQEAMKLLAKVPLSQSACAGS